MRSTFLNKLPNLPQLWSSFHMGEDKVQELHFRKLRQSLIYRTWRARDSESFHGRLKLCTGETETVSRAGEIARSAKKFEGFRGCVQKFSQGSSSTCVAFRSQRRQTRNNILDPTPPPKNLDCAPKLREQHGQKVVKVSNLRPAQCVGPSAPRHVLRQTPPPESRTSVILPKSGGLERSSLELDGRRASKLETSRHTKWQAVIPLNVSNLRTLDPAGGS